MRNRFIFLAVFAAVAGKTLPAHAQAWLADRRVAEGMGVRAGDLELHPGIGGEVGYDSNYFQRSGNDSERVLDVERDVESAVRFRITPHLALSTIDRRRVGEGGGVGSAPPVVAFRAEAAASYNELIGSGDGADEIADQRHIAGNIGGRLDILPEGQVGVDLNAAYRRTVEPSNFPDTSRAFDRGTITAGAGVNWRPGGGLFRWRLGYALRATIFEDVPFEGLDNLQHTVQTGGRWAFLPRTVLLYDGQIRFINFSDNVSDNDGQIVRSSIGVNGLITNHFGLLAMFGWAASFYTADAVTQRNFDGPIGQLEATFYPLPQATVDPGGAAIGLSTVSLGYTRDYSNSYLGDYFRRDRVYLNATYLFGGRFVVVAVAGYSRITRPDIFMPAQTEPVQTSYGENRVDASLFAEYRLSDTVGINTTFRYDANLTDQVIDPTPNNNTDQNGDDVSFNRWQIYLGARWFL